MKNFPHQVSNLDKLTGALKVADDLLKAGADAGSDGRYGAALARAGVYAFRQDGDVDQLLALEAQKPAANRGTLTAARELRRFLIMSGFLEAGNLGDLRVSAAGRELLASKGAVRNDLWRSAMLALAVRDADGRTSHPYRILLRLAADQPGIDTAKLMLAFEAVDDSEEEYTRILELADLSFAEILAATGVPTASAANAIKILPSIAEQVGDIERRNKRAFPRIRFDITEDVFTQAAKAEPVPTSSPTAPPAAFSEVAPDAMGAEPNFSPTQQTNVDLSDAIELRKARTKEHQETVRSLAKLLDGRGFALSQHPFDCLALKAKSTLLIEVKTLDGSPADERRQCERAVGQLAGYSHFDLPGNVRDYPCTKIAGFSRPPSKAALAFLADCGIQPIWRDEDGSWQTSGKNGDLILFEP